jgi:hypothetical protein
MRQQLRVIEVNGRWCVVQNNRIRHIAKTNEQAWRWVDRQHGVKSKGGCGMERVVSPRLGIASGLRG